MVTTAEQLLTHLIDALARHDRSRLAEVMAATVSLRALLPGRYVELAGVDAVAAEMLGWFDEVPEIVMAQANVEPVGDIWHAAFRFALRGMGVERVVEQHAYCTVVDGSIDTIRLLCSGFRPAHPPEAQPRADRYLDALGAGCATLTPAIAAALRELRPGEVLAVLADDPSAPDGVAAWSRMTGHRIVATAAEGAATRYYLRRA